MKKRTTNQSASSTAERYFSDLETPALGADGKFRERAPRDFVGLLRSLQGSYRPKYDLSRCIAGAPDFSGQVWFWSDQHLCHPNILGFCNRPFNSVDHMNHSMLENCLARVQKEDIVVFGGDVMMKDLRSANKILRAIPGYKVLVAGNHDCEGASLLALAVDEVAPCLELRFEDRPVFVSHYPIREHLLEFRQVNIHGHLHDKPLPNTLGTGERHVNFCVERTGYAPMLLGDILRLN